MPLPPRIAHIASHHFNPTIGRVLVRLPWFATVIHPGRISGKLYRTPIVPFRRGEQVIFALTYGPQTDWVHNTLAANGCTLMQRARTFTIIDPELVHDPTRSLMPWFVRPVLCLFGVTDFLVATICPGNVQDLS